MSDYLSKIVYLTDDQYTTLINNHNTTIGGHKYDPTALYITNTSGNASTVNGHTVNSDVPYGALFTDHYHTTGTWDDMTYTAQSVNNANELSFTLPTIPVSSGGTGVTSFTANSVIMSGSTATANLTTRSIYTLSAAGDSGWNTTANRTKIPDMSFIAYWNGAYNGNSSNITKLGTISTGIWQGTSIKVGYGGTGTTTAPTKGGIIYGASTSAYASTSAGTAGQYLKSNGADAPTWATIQPSELGLANALHFIGITSTVLTDGSTTSTLTAKSTNSLTKTTGFTDGDVVMDSDQLREYVWSGDAWRLLGITTSTTYTQPASTATNTWISQITQGTNGEITATTGTLDTTGTWSGDAKRLGKSDAVALNNFTHETDLIYTYAAGSNGLGDKPSGVDAFGAISLKTANGWYGQLLISSNMSSGIYWRTATSLSGGWNKILDSNNTSSGTNNAATLTWSTTYTIAKINGTDIKFTTMAKPTYAFSNLTSHPTTLAGYGITDAATSDHIHGNISNDGKIGVSNNWTLASNDGLIVFDASNSYKLERSSIVFDNSTTTEALSRKGTWETVNNVNISADITDNNDYPIPFATSTTSTAIAVAEELQKNTEKLYFNPSSGKLNATKVQVDEHVTLQWNSTDLALEFVFS